jgi:hypothetical protein
MQPAYPRAPIARAKSGTLDYEDRYKYRIQQFRLACREQAQRQVEENKEWSNISRYISALEGRYWARERASYRSRFTDNQMARAREESLSMYADVQPTISVSSKNEAYEKTAALLTGINLHVWNRENLDMELVEVVDHAMLSVGYWKINGAPGRVSAKSYGMDTVMPINATSDIQESSAIRYRVWKPLTYFQQKFPAKWKKVAESCRNYSRTGDETYSYAMGMTEYTYNNLSPAMKHLMKNRKPPRARTDEQEVFPVAELEEIWIEDVSLNDSGQIEIVKNPDLALEDHNYWYQVKPGERRFPRKRLMVFGGDELLYDGPSPYWTTRYPFARLALNPVIWAPGGLSMYRTLMPLNEGINEIGAGIFDTIKKAINQTYLMKQGSVRDADWDRFFPDMPGAKLRMTPIGNPSGDIKALDPPNLPSYVREFLMTYLLPVFDRHAGTFDVNSLSKKKQVPGGDVFEQIRDAQSGPKRLHGRRIEVFLRDAGEIATALELQYYSREDRYHIFGADGWTDDDFDARPGTMVPATEAKETFWRQFSMDIERSSLHGASKDREQTKYVTLFKAGAISLKTLLKKMAVPNVDAEIQQIMEERQQGMGAQGGAGRTPRLSRGQRTGSIA